MTLQADWLEELKNFISKGKKGLFLELCSIEKCLCNLCAPGGGEIFDFGHRRMGIKMGNQIAEPPTTQSPGYPDKKIRYEKIDASAHRQQHHHHHHHHTNKILVVIILTCIIDHNFFLHSTSGR